MDLLDAWYAAVGHELHVEGGKPHDPEVARTLLARIGIEPTLLDEALADETTHEDVKSDHQRVLDAGGFGVPALFLPDDQCLFGPVLVDPPSVRDAVRLWEVVTGMAELGLTVPARWRRCGLRTRRTRRRRPTSPPWWARGWRLARRAQLRSNRRRARAADT
jgi:mycothiol-dependent nitroreductase-like protein